MQTVILTMVFGLCAQGAELQSKLDNAEAQLEKARATHALAGQETDQAWDKYCRDADIERTQAERQLSAEQHWSHHCATCSMCPQYTDTSCATGLRAINQLQHERFLLTLATRQKDEAYRSYLHACEAEGMALVGVRSWVEREGRAYWDLQIHILNHRCDESP